MLKPSAFHDYVMEELFLRMPHITSRAMFGGYGIYQNGLFFGLIDNDQLYFKVDDKNRADYEKYDSAPFIYIVKGKQMTMSYWLVPEEIMENPLQFERWTKKAIDAAGRAKADKKKKP